MTIKEIRAMAGLSQKAFSEKYNIPKRSIENWETEKSKCPEYVVELLEFRVKADIKKNKN